MAKFDDPSKIPPNLILGVLTTIEAKEASAFGVSSNVVAVANLKAEAYHRSAAADAKAKEFLAKYKRTTNT